jgi:hypothetical protein
MFFIILLLLLLSLFTAIGFSPGGSSPYTITHNTNGHIHKITIRYKIHTVNTSTHIRTPYTHYKNIHSLQKHPHLTKTSTTYKNTHTHTKQNTYSKYKYTH